MNKKILSALLLAAFSFASTSMFVSCKDYDDDIKSLQTQIDGLKGTLTTIQTQIQNGAILTSVTPVTGGVQITLNQGGNPQTYTITNGKDGAQGEKGEKGDTGATGAAGANGKDGTVWTIEQVDGVYYWFKDGVNQNIQAQGPKGEKGDKGEQGEKGEKGDTGATGATGEGGSSAGTGIYYVPNNETGCFDKYQDGKFVEHTTITFLSDNNNTPSGIITAVKTNDVLTLYGVEGGEGSLKTFTLSLSGVLKSLVFIPHFYLDGIETIEYPWFGDSTLVRKDGLATYKQDGSNRSKMTHHGKTITGAAKIMSNYLPDNLSHEPQRPIPTREAVIYGPVIGVDYEINPSNAALSHDANKPSYNVLEPDVVYANTRAAAATLKVSSPKTYGLYTAPSKEVFGIMSSRSTYVEPYSKAVGNDGTGNSSVNYLQAGLKIDQPQYLEPYPTSQDLNGGYLPAPATLDGSYTLPWGTWYQWYKDDTSESGKHKDTDNTIALQLNNIENGSVTSDYAMVIPSRLRLEGLVWTKNPSYDEPHFGPSAAQTGDEKGWYSTTDQKFIWDSPEEALDNDLGAALDLPIGEGSSVDLKEWIGIRILKENVKTRKVGTADWKANEFNEDGKKFGKEEYYNLHYEFTLIDYQTSGNVTGDSRYATFNDTDLEAAAKFDILKSDEANKDYISKTGVIRALTVDEQKKTMNVSSSTARDREPLVRILVKTNDGKVMLDGYILLHITETNPNLLITSYPAQEKSFTLCNKVTYVTDWAQFSKLVLQDAMKTSTFPTGYTKQSFDAMYWADCIVNTGATVSTKDAPFVSPEALQVNTTADGHKTYSMKIFNFGSDIYGNDGSPAVLGNSNDYLDPVMGTKAFEDKPLGVVEYFPNADGQTNHRWEWTLTKEEIEYLTKGKNVGEIVPVTRWIRFQAKNFDPGTTAIPGESQDDYQAPWPYVWVKMTINLKREPLQALYTKKIKNYWYNYSTGVNENGWTGYLLDIEAPGSISQTGHTPNFTPVTHAATGIKNENWFGRISNTLYTNIPVLAKYVEDNTPTGIEGTTALAATYQKGWYYFSPKTSEITGVSGTKYVITPKRNVSDTSWDKLYDKYLVKNNTFTKINNDEVGDVIPTKATIQYTQPAFTWKEKDKLQEYLTHYTIDAGRGAFLNDTLYANPKGTNKYIPIAYITKQAYSSADGATSVNAGQIMLFHWLDNADAKGQTDPNAAHENWVCYDVLNAIGYINKGKISNENIQDQLHAWLGFVGVECASTTDAGVAFYVEQDQFDVTDVTDWSNKATVEASWERPINLLVTDPDAALDAKTNENYVYLVDNLRMYDWRGPKGTFKVGGNDRTFNLDGYMWDNHYWFWGWYNVQAAIINLNPAKVKIKLNDDVDFQPLNEVTTQLRLRPVANATAVPTTVDKDPYKSLLDGASYWAYTDLTQYASEAKESQIEQELGVNPVNKTNKAKFGGFYYENISGNVEYFYVQIPVGIRYEWGWQFGTVTWKINTTQGN